MTDEAKSFSAFLRETVLHHVTATRDEAGRGEKEEHRLAEEIGSGAHDPGAIVYYPEMDEDVGQASQPLTVVDRKTGWRLNGTSDRPREDRSGLTRGWRISDANHGTVLLFTTVRSQGYRRGYGKTDALTVVLAHRDSFFPYEDALYPDDVSFARVAQMLNLHDHAASSNRYRGHLVVIDNRVAHMAGNKRRAAEQSHDTFQVANHAINPALYPGAEVVYASNDEGVRYDPDSMTVTDSRDGSSLKGWRAGDREYPRWDGLWHDTRSGLTAKVSTVPMRGYKPGYGETTTLELTSVAWERVEEGRMKSDPISRDEMPTERLARLLNHFGAATAYGKKEGNLVVIDTRSYKADGRY